MVQDRKAIQAGTSHFLGQNFSRSSGIQFQTRDGKQEFGWTTSWGVSTRMIGTVIMMHADDDGLVLPPRIAPTHIVIMPITPKPETRDAVLAAANELAAQLRAITWHGAPLEVHVDQRDLGGGVKNWEWIKKGVPLRVELGPRDLESGNVAVTTPRPGREGERLSADDGFVSRAPDLLDAIQENLFERALAFRDEHTRAIDTKEEFYAFFTPKNPPSRKSTAASRSRIGTARARSKSKLRTTSKSRSAASPSTIRPTRPRAGSCVITGEPSPRRVIWAKSY